MRLLLTQWKRCCQMPFSRLLQAEHHPGICLSLPAERPRSCTARWTAWQPSQQPAAAAAAASLQAAAAMAARPQQQRWMAQCTPAVAHPSTCWCARAARHGCRTFCCGNAGTRCWCSPRCCGQSLGSWTWWQRCSSTSGSMRTCSGCRQQLMRRRRRQRRQRCTTVLRQRWLWQ